MGVIATLAKKANINSVQELAWAAKITRPIAYRFWADDFGESKLSTVRKVKDALNTSLDEMEEAVKDDEKD
jgi:hypothetical protein